MNFNDLPEEARAQLVNGTPAELRELVRVLLSSAGWLEAFEPDAGKRLKEGAAAVLMIAFYSFGVRPRRFRGDRVRTRRWGMLTRLLPLAVLIATLVGCAAPEHAAGGEASEKDRAGKLPEQTNPYDPEPDAQATPDAGVAGTLVERPDASQAPRDDGGAPVVDSGGVLSVAGPWRVIFTPVGMSCGGAKGGDEEWGGSPEGDTLATPSGTLSRVQGGFQGVLSGQWAATLTLELSPDGFAGQLARKGASCSDRWRVEGVRV